MAFQKSSVSYALMLEQFTSTLFLAKVCNKIITVITIMMMMMMNKKFFLEFSKILNTSNTKRKADQRKGVRVKHTLYSVFHVVFSS